MTLIITIILFCATTRLGSHALMLKKHIHFLILSSAAALPVRTTLF